MTTRLSSSAKADSLAGLRELLGNVIGFTELPTRDRTLIASLWNGQQPLELVQAVSTLGRHDIGMGQGGMATDLIRWVTDIRGVPHLARIDCNELEDRSKELMLKGVVQYMLNTDANFARAYKITVVEDTNKKVLGRPGRSAMRISENDMGKVLGADLTEEVISWMQRTAVLRDQLITANLALTSIFDMAQTAGQIKRMVPDLLQYLPVKQRLAFEEQKRASSAPFEWAPFPKKDVDVMMEMINKGHLLKGLTKPYRHNRDVALIDHTGSWTRTDFIIE
jgi:hypothetical protein